MSFVWRFLRDATVSAISTTVSLTVLGVLVFTKAMSSPPVSRPVPAVEPAARSLDAA